MPTVDAYEEKVRSTGLFDFRVWGEVADRSFSADRADRVDRTAVDRPVAGAVASDVKRPFRDDVVAEMLERTKQDRNYLETFRRINLLARKK